MATINSLPNLTNFKAINNVVVENSTGNYKTPLPVAGALIASTPIEASETVRDGINKAINIYIEKYGYESGVANVVTGWNQHSNGAQFIIHACKGYAGQYTAFFGFAFTQNDGVYAFTRFDPYATQTAGALRVGQVYTGSLA